MYGLHSNMRTGFTCYCFFLSWICLVYSPSFRYHYRNINKDNVFPYTKPLALTFLEKTNSPHLPQRAFPLGPPAQNCGAGLVPGPRERPSRDNIVARLTLLAFARAHEQGACCRAHVLDEEIVSWVQLVHAIAPA